jgi:alanine dehydrogenase
MAVGLGAHVCVLDRNIETLRQLDARYGNRITTLYSTRASLREQVLGADLVIGAVLIPGAAAPKLITREMVSQMLPGSVLVDVAIDQGGCAETSRPTTHAEPTYLVDEVVHYCVANMPGAVARTSTQALNNATLPFIIALAEKGPRRAMEEDPHLLNGLNLAKGLLTNAPVAAAQGLISQPALKVLQQL